MKHNPVGSQDNFPGTPEKTGSERAAVAKAAGVVGVWTVLSRILGFVRDMVTALFLGAGPGADAFFVAFRIPNLLRRLFAEGALTAAFIPTYVDVLRRNGKTEAAHLARVVFTFAALVLLAVTVLGALMSPYIVRLIAPGFLGDASKFELTVHLNRIMFPYILFISLTALASGVLNAMGHFAAPAAAPTLLNICMIGAVALFAGVWGAAPYEALAWGVVLAGVLQLALQIPFMVRLGVKMYPEWDFAHPELRRIGLLFGPAALGGAVYQINVMVGTILASLLPGGGVSWLYYADRLVELPLGVFAIALGTAVLPSMSRQASAGDIGALSRTVSFALRLIAFFTIPASVGLILLREPVIALLFQRGLFTAVDTAQTADALLWYTAGLWAFSALKVVTQAFFSLKDTKTPVWFSVVAVLLNLGAGLALMGPMAQGGLALATSLAAAGNVIGLFIVLVKRLGNFPLRELAYSLLRTTAAAGVMGVFLLYCRTLGNWTLGLTMTNGFILAAALFGGLAVFFAAAYVLKCRELQAMPEMIRRTRNE